MHEIKCDHCNEWTPGNLKHCQHCGGELRHEEKRERSERKKKGDLKPELIKIHPDDAWYVVMAKHIGRLGQIIFYLIVSILVWVTTWTVG